MIQMRPPSTEAGLLEQQQLSGWYRQFPGKQRLNDEINREAGKARKRAIDTPGLLIRIDALEQLASDRTPFGNTTAPARRGLFGLTTLGKVVWGVRLWLVLLDLMPVAFKLILSLRRRRPYDALVAEREELVTTVAAERVDEAYQDLEAARDRHAVERELEMERLHEQTVVEASASPLRLTGPSGSRSLQPGKRGSVGSHPECTLTVEDPRVRAVHLTINYQSGRGWVIADQSRGHTYQTGVPVDEVVVNGNGPWS